VREFTIETWDTVLFSISLVVAMLVIDPGLTLVALLPVPIAMLLAHASGRWIAGRTLAARSINAQLTTAIQEQLAGARVLRLFGRRAAAIAAVSELSRQQADANLALIRLRAGLNPVYSTLVTAGIVAIVWFGGERVLAGVLSVGTFVAYLELFGRFVGRAYRIPQLVNSVQSGAAAYARLRLYLASPLGVAGAPRFGSFLPNQLPGNIGPAHQLARPGGPVRVHVRSATFRYPGAADYAFKDLSLDIPAGAFVAITGPVGSGKSALARCLAGLYLPESGEICVDRVSAFAAAPGLIGYAPQEGYLFSGSVRDNVFLGVARPAAEFERVVDMAALGHDLETLPSGADTLIGELGVRISGGQRQRLGVARAAAASPGLLVLDDPFSAVDVNTEAKIVANLRTAFGSSAPATQRATVVLFSHRLGAFPYADRIFVLDGGRIVESGTHASLVDAGGLYARIYRAQLRVDGAAPLAASSV
jgi:ABC-type multidrug transport system fused ATPase/permease subunit